MDETLAKKLRILADAAKYDASCASSGAPKRAAGKDGLGSTTGAGICHAYTPDGRCVSLLKILLTNWCLFDCAYCVNRRSSNVRRAKFTVEEVAHILQASHEEGLVLSEQFGRLDAAIEFSDKDASDVGVRLADLVTVGLDTTPDDIERLVAKRGFSRYPVAGADGYLIGYLHLKDVLFADEEERLQPVPAKRIRRMANVRRTDEVESVLRTMQQTGSHLARVVADDGEVVGVVFLEDVIEQLVGEVADASQR